MHALFLLFVELCNLRMSVYVCFHMDLMNGCCDGTNRDIRSSREKQFHSSNIVKTRKSKNTLKVMHSVLTIETF